jgi:branched-chain amino acid transport system substrate-binding protein
MIVSEVSYEVTDPTVDSQIVTLKGSGADTFFNITTPKFAAQAIRKAYDIDWHPLQLLNNVSQAVGSVLTPAGLEKSVDIISTAYLKDPTDPQFKDDSGMQEWRAFMAKYLPDADVKDIFNVYGYTAARTLEQVLRQCGDDLTRKNVMTQAAHLDLALDTMQPGVRATTSPTDFNPMKQMRLQKFNGTSWVPFGGALGS